MFESVARVSLATVGGGWAGMAMQKKQPPNYPSGRRPRVQQGHLPRQWALSCCLFCAILETMRLTSPSTILYHQFAKAMRSEDTDTKDLQAPTPTIQNPLTEAALVVADYTIGGLLAGGAAAVVRPMVGGVVLGTGLGAAAGILQGSILYFEETAKQALGPQNENAKGE